MILAELLDLKRTDDAGLTAQLTQQMRALMASGRIRSGAVLPSSRTLSAELDVSRNQIAVGALAFNEQFALLLPADRKFTMSLVQNDISNEQAGLLNLQGSLLRPRQKLAVLAPRTGVQNVEGGILVVKLRDQEFRFRCTWMLAAGADKDAQNKVPGCA